VPGYTYPPPPLPPLPVGKTVIIQNIPPPLPPFPVVVDLHQQTLSDLHYRLQRKKRHYHTSLTICLAAGIPLALFVPVVGIAVLVGFGIKAGIEKQHVERLKSEIQYVERNHK